MSLLGFMDNPVASGPVYGSVSGYAGTSVGWTNNATGAVGPPDGIYANSPANFPTATLGSFGLSVPSNAVIDGIAITVTAYKSGNGICYLRDMTLNQGVKQTYNVSITTLANYTVGGSTSLWGGVWAPADISNLTLAWRPLRSGGTGGFYIYCDCVLATVYYHTN